MAAAAMLAGLLYSQRQSAVVRVSGFIEADDIRLGSRIGGRVKMVHVQEGARVAAGDLLIELEPFDLTAKLAQAESNLAAQQALLSKMESGLRPEEIAQAQAHFDNLNATLAKLVAGPRREEIDAARAYFDLAQAHLNRAKKSHERAVDLFNHDAKAITREDFDAAVEELQTAESTLQARRQELQLLIDGTRSEDIAAAKAATAEAKASLELAQKGYRQEEITQTRAAVQAAQAAVAAIEAQLQELQIHATVNGIVDALEMQPGDLIPPNGPVLTLLDVDHLWLRAYIPENQLFWQPGDEVEVTVDSFPGKRLKGTISFIAAQGEFTPRNVQTPEERAKQVFRIKVQLPADAGLRVGMGADLWLDNRGSQRKTTAGAPLRE